MPFFLKVLIFHTKNFFPKHFGSLKDTIIFFLTQQIHQKSFFLGKNSYKLEQNDKKNQLKQNWQKVFFTRKTLFYEEKKTFSPFFLDFFLVWTIVTKLNGSNCHMTQKLKLWQNSQFTFWQNFNNLFWQ